MNLVRRRIIFLMFCAVCFGGYEYDTVTWVNNDTMIDLSGISVTTDFNSILKLGTKTQGVSNDAVTFPEGFHESISGIVRLSLIGSVSVDSLLTVGVDSDPYRRLYITADGKIFFGDGTTGVPNVNLYWGGNNILKTDDGFMTGALITGNAGFLDPSDSTAAAPGMALGDSGDSGLYVTTDDEEIGLSLVGVSKLEYDSFLTGTWTMHFSDDWLQFTKGRIISSTGEISFLNEDLKTTGDLNIGTGGTVLDVDSTLETVGIGTAAVATSKLNVTQSSFTATDDFFVIGGAASVTIGAAAKEFNALKYRLILTPGEDTTLIRGVAAIVDISGGGVANVTIDDVIGFHSDLSILRGGPGGIPDVTASKRS